MNEKYKINQKYKGIFYIVMAALFFSGMNTFVRLAGELPSMQKSFFRNIVALIFATIILQKSGIGFSFQRKNLKDFIWRGTFGTIGILCNFYAVDQLVLADASMLNKMSPFFAILFGYLLLKEKVGGVQIFAIIVAFVGSLFIIKPSFQNVALIPAIAGFIGGMAAGLAYTFVRILGKKGEKGPFIVFFFSAFSSLVTLPFFILQYEPMTPIQVLCLILAGLSASGGQFAVTAAYFHSPAKEISIYDYSQIIFSAIFGFLLFDQIPDAYSVLGYVLICGMAVFMFLYNTNRLKLKRD